MDADPQPMPTDSDAEAPAMAAPPVDADSAAVAAAALADDVPLADVAEPVAGTPPDGAADPAAEPSPAAVDDPTGEAAPGGVADAGDASVAGTVSTAVDGPAAEAATPGGVEIPPLEALPDDVPPTLEPAPAVAEAFRAFYHHLGPTLCGAPVSPLVEEGGMPTQYFQHVALESPLPGHVRLKSIGEAAWEARRLRSARPPTATTPVIDDLTGQLARHPGRAYATRPLTHVRYLVLHATGAPAHVGPHAIARAHVDDNGWPGIGYHFVVGAEGAVYRTQDLTVVSHHAAQFNPVAVGIALAGDLAHADPPPAQLAAAADLVAQLCWDLGLPATAVRGHREMVPTPCPGERFLDGWKPRLMRAVADRLETQAARAAADGLDAGTPDASAAAAQGVAPGA